MIKKSFPVFPGLAAALGPGIIWLALAQGSGELIWWPYIVAKYGLGLICLMVPACLLQYPLNYHIGCYTLLTGESIFQGFIRLNRAFAFFLWCLATLSFLWFGAFASAGGTALARLTDFPAGWDARGQTLFWAYASMLFFLSGILFSRVIYQFIEKVMWAVAIITLLGLVLSCFHPAVLQALPDFSRALFIPQWPQNIAWEPRDATRLLTAVSFAGLGGFWTLFYSYWLREKGAGMAAYAAPLSGLIGGTQKAAELSDMTFSAAPENLMQVKKWKRFLKFDAGVGILGNIATTLMTCLLAYAFLFPEGLLPEKYELAVVQARFFEMSWGWIGKAFFLVVAACFLADTWGATLDAVSRMHSDFVIHYFPWFAKWGFRKCYFFFIGLFTLVTFITVLFDEPGTLILLSAVIGFIGTVSFSFAIIFLNRKVLPRLIPREAVPGKFSAYLLLVSASVYLLLAILYVRELLLAKG